MASYPNPVLGHIYPKGASAPSGAFRITRTSADHVATGQGKGLDIGNGRCDGKVFTIASGKVLRTDAIQGIVQIDHSANADVSHYAHMKPVLVAPGATVAAGQQIGVVSDAHDPSITNFAACHLHFGITRNGESIDPWPELAQNQGGSTGGDMTTIVNATMFLGSDGKPAPRTLVFAAGRTYTGYALDGTTEAFTPGANGSSAPVDAQCVITQNPDRSPHGSCVRITAGVFADHPYIGFPSPGLSLSPAPPIGGCTQDELDDAYNAGRSAVQAAAAGVPPK